MLGGASAPLPWPYEAGGHRTMTTDDNPSLSAQQLQNGHRGGHYSMKEDNIITRAMYLRGGGHYSMKEDNIITRAEEEATIQ